MIIKQINQIKGERERGEREGEGGRERS